MLELVLGTAGTGKTWKLIEEIRERAEQKKYSVFIVPEQFSSTAELTLYEKLGDRLCAYVGVYSFRSVAEKIEAVYGGGAKKTVTDAGRVVLARRAASQVADRLVQYRGNRRNTAFCRMCADAIKELKIAGARPEDLQELEPAHLKELGLIYEAYESILPQTGLDPTDRLVLAAQRAGEGFLAPAWFFIDNFDGFTAPEYVMLRRFVECGEGCTVALCTDCLQDSKNGLGLFSPVQRTAGRLCRFTGRENTKLVQLQGNLRTQKEGLRFVERFLREGKRTPQPPKDGSVRVGSAPDLYEEVRMAAALLHELLQKGEQPEKLALVCRDVTMYREEIERQFALWGLPYFIDATGTVETTAPAVFLRAALGILREGICTKRVLQLLKSGLCNVPDTLLGELENYAYVWQLSAADWRQEFTKSPAGLQPRNTQEEADTLQRMEQLRSELYTKLEQFRERAKNTDGRGLSEQLYWLADAFGAPQAVMQAAEILRKQGKEAEAEENLRLWDVTIGLLDEMANLLGKEKANPQEYDELFLLLVRNAEVGHLPRTPHQIIVTGADRMRLDEPRHVIVLGMNEDVFPAQVGYSGLLTHADRELLVEKGIEMPGAFENRVLLEEMFVYRALTAPSESLTLLWHTTDAAGAAQKSQPLAALCDAMETEELSLSTVQLAATPLAAVDFLAGRYHNGDAETEAIKQALWEDAQYRPLMEQLQKAESEELPCVEDTAALQKLLGKHMRLSPTRVEQYYSCRYAYFLQFVLKILPRRKAEMDVMQSGTFVHYLLEQVLKSCGNEFVTKTKEELEQQCGVTAQAYLATYLPDIDKNERFMYLLQKLQDNVVQLLLFMQEEQRQSGFHPVSYELPIGRENGVPALVVTGGEGETVELIGQVDRVDLYQKDGTDYLRIVDYKTGTKDFRLDEVFNGLNTQMLLYLATLHQNGMPCAPHPESAGVLYVMSDPAPKTKSRTEAAQSSPNYTVDGLILDNEDVISAMDFNSTGKYVPLSFLKSGGFRKTDKAAKEEELQQILSHVKKLVVKMADELYQGNIDAKPIVKYDKHTPCEYCAYRTICRHEDGQNEQALLKKEDIFGKEEKA